MPLSQADLDVADDPADWLFAPIGVLSHAERDHINLSQAFAFAAYHGLIVICWAKELRGANAMHLNEAEAAALSGSSAGLGHEAAALCHFFIKGAPGMITENVATFNKLANGTPCICHSLTLPDGYDLEEMLDELGENDTFLFLPIAPISVNVIPEIDDALKVKLLADGASLVNGELVVPIHMGKKVEAFVPTSVHSAKQGIPPELKCRGHAWILAWALTDFK